MAATTSSSSTTPAGFFNLRSNPLNPSKVRHPPSFPAGCSKLDGFAMWVVNGVAAAFFASLDRCSCIRIATVDDVEEGNDDAPLIMNDGNVTPPCRGGGSRRRRTAAGGKGKKATTTNLFYGESNN